MKTILATLSAVTLLVGCGNGGGSAATSSANSSSAPASTGTARAPKPASAPAATKPELKSVDDAKMGYTVSVPKEADAKTESASFHTYSLGMPVDYAVAIQLMDDNDTASYKTAEEFAQHEKSRFTEAAVSTKELGKDRFLVVFPQAALHGKSVEANLWIVSGKKRFWVRCSALEPNLDLATEMCSSFKPK
jgi:hypothetical protein